MPLRERMVTQMAIVTGDNIGPLVRRTLDHVDSRLMDHGERVAYIVKCMLEIRGANTPKEIQDICFLAVLHDIGAYKTEEIDQMVQFETHNVWAHSVYGCLFIRYLTPLKELASAILYHHLDYRRLRQIGDPNWKIAQIIHLADRAELFFRGRERSPNGFREYLERVCGEQFDEETEQLFFRADEELRILEGLAGDSGRPQLPGYMNLSEEEIDICLKMLIFSIDFRSRHTVTHTITTTVISTELARRMGFSDEECGMVRYGALLHDLGKIGIPVDILESPGRLSVEEMAVMRTHVVITEEILEGYLDPEVLKIAVRHHEKLDGSGYPRGLKADSLTTAQRILAVADIASALYGARSYKNALPKAENLLIIGKMCRKGQLDTEIFALLERDFDEIIRRVEVDCQPLLDLYDRLQREFGELLRECEAL